VIEAQRWWLRNLVHVRPAREALENDCELSRDLSIRADCHGPV